eukprot:269678-Amphidinium_carterae.1
MQRTYHDSRFFVRLDRRTHGEQGPLDSGSSGLKSSCVFGTHRWQPNKPLSSLIHAQRNGKGHCLWQELHKRSGHRQFLAQWARGLAGSHIALRHHLNPRALNCKGIVKLVVSNLQLNSSYTATVVLHEPSVCWHMKSACCLHEDDVFAPESPSAHSQKLQLQCGTDHRD